MLEKKCIQYLTPIAHSQHARPSLPIITHFIKDLKT